MENKFLITFAGAVGSSKTPIAYYLSWKLNLPVFNNDSIRTEVIEDFGGFDVEKYQKCLDKRLKEIADSKISLIYDASIDREWDNQKKNVESLGYKVFIISLDLSKELLVSLYNQKKYFESLTRIDSLIADHEFFLKHHMDEVNLHITDKEFADRLELSYEKVRDWKDTLT